MIRVRVRDWTPIKRLIKNIALVCAIGWGALGWLLMVPIQIHKHDPFGHALLNIGVGMLLWLGPFVLAGILWLINAVFEFQWENPFDRVPRR